MKGRIAGPVSLLGASTVDGIYCALSGLGFFWVFDLLKQNRALIQLLGSMVLIALAFMIFFSQPRIREARGQIKENMASFSSTFLLALANPMPLLIFTAAFAGLGLQGWRGDGVGTVLFVAGVFSGSALWSPILIAFASLFTPLVDVMNLRLMNKISGVIICLFGLALSLTTLLGR